MKILAIIPARAGSKGVPGKNIRPLGGKPLLQWTIETALAVAGLARVVASTEDAEIADLARAGGAEVPFLRPPNLATDTAKSIDVVINVLQTLESKGESYDAVCLLQATTPYRSVALLQRAIEDFESNDFTGLISVSSVPTHYHPNWAFVAEGNLLTPAQGVGSVIPRRQALPPAFVRDGAVYHTRTEVLLERSFFGDRLGYIENTDARRVNIDTPAEWALAESMLQTTRKD